MEHAASDVRASVSGHGQGTKHWGGETDVQAQGTPPSKQQTWLRGCQAFVRGVGAAVDQGWKQARQQVAADSGLKKQWDRAALWRLRNLPRVAPLPKRSCFCHPIPSHPVMFRLVLQFIVHPATSINPNLAFSSPALV